MLTGPDVSHHQGVINWAEVARAGHAFAWIKRTEGVTFVDPRGLANWQQAAAAGLVRGAYHFMRRDPSPIIQAAHFVATVRDFDGALAALDVETSPDGSNPGIDSVVAFAREFHRLTDKTLLIYTNRAWWARHSLGRDGADLGPLWHARWATSPGPLYGGWPRVTFWQHTSSGRCPGIAGPCDLNQFFGDRADLAALTGGDDMNQTELRTELRTGESRKILKSLAQGAVLDGLRPATDGVDDRGMLRHVLVDIIDERLRPVTARIDALIAAIAEEGNMDVAALAKALVTLLPVDDLAAAIAEQLPLEQAQAVATTTVDLIAAKLAAAATAPTSG